MFSYKHLLTHTLWNALQFFLKGFSFQDGPLTVSTTSRTYITKGVGKSQDLESGNKV